jgi:hypothetical protein
MRAIRYSIALGIFTAAWFGGTVLVWLCTEVLSPSRPNEFILVGQPTDWRNITANIGGALAGVSLAMGYLRTTRKKNKRSPNA